MPAIAVCLNKLVVRGGEMMERADVVVVGAGLAGLNAAGELAGSGLKVLVVDRQPEVGATIRTSGIFVREVVKTHDIPPSVLGEPLSDVWLYAPSLRVLKLRSREPEFWVADMRAVLRWLSARCRARGVEFALSTTFTGLDAGPHGVSVALTRGGRSYRVAARFVVGADGARSRVARALGLRRRPGPLLHGLEWIYRVRGSLPAHALHCFLSARLAPGYIAWAIPHPGELRIGTAGFLGRNGFRPGEALERLRDLLARMGVRFEAVVERRGGLIPTRGVGGDLFNRYGLVIGDAAGTVSPFTAGGIGPTFHFPPLAAGAIRAYLDTGRTDGLRRYDGTLRAWSRGRHLWARRLYDHVIADALLEAAHAVLGTPLARWVASRIYFGRHALPAALELAARTDAAAR